MIPENFWLYLQILFFLFITPGSPRILMCSYTMTYGLKKSYWTAVGDISANSLQLILVVLGLGLIIKNNILILLILKWVGVFYLIYIAIDLYKSKAKIINSENINKKNILSFYKDGFLVAALSPKAWIFFSVIFIQFLNYNLNFLNFIAQLIILWISYIFLDFITLILYGVTAKKISMWLKSNPKTINVISALALFMIAIYIAFN